MAETAVARKDKPANITDLVENKVNEMIRNGRLDLPADYSAPNALRSAWLELQATEDKDGNPVLQTCDRASIMNALLDMVVQGLTPAKDQCYFIAYGKELVCQRSYFGHMTLAKRVMPGVTFLYDVIYEGDQVKMEGAPGKRRVVDHVQDFDNIDPNKITGAYCMIEDEESRLVSSVVMTMSQIQQSWRQGATNGNSPAHKKFPDQMALKTVIGRACKPIINSSSDSYLETSMNRASEIRAEATIEQEVEENANGKVLDLSRDQVREKQPEEQSEPKPASEEDWPPEGMDEAFEASGSKDDAPF